MNVKPEFVLETFRQMAFISALIGGFAFSFVGVLLALKQRTSIVHWIIGITITASCGLIVCTLGWTMSANFIYPLAAEKVTDVPLFVKNMHRSLSLTFIGCLLLFLVSLGLSGWIRSRWLGIISSVVAFVAILNVLVILSLFVK